MALSNASLTLLTSSLIFSYSSLDISITSLCSNVFHTSLDFLTVQSLALRNPLDTLVTPLNVPIVPNINAPPTKYKIFLVLSVVLDCCDTALAFDLAILSSEESFSRSNLRSSDCINIECFSRLSSVVNATLGVRVKSITLVFIVSTGLAEVDNIIINNNADRLVYFIY